MVIYAAIFSPLELGFLPTFVGYVRTVNFVCDIAIIFDTLLTFFVAYVCNSSYKLITDHKKIFERYVSTWFVFDLASSVVPLACMQRFPVLIVFRVFRLHKLGVSFDWLENIELFNFTLARCTRLFLATLLTAHTGGCLLYYIAKSRPNSKNNWMDANADNPPTRTLVYWYVSAIYWSITTITTVGFGDIHPFSIGEMVFVAAYMVFNFFWTCYLLGNISNILLHGYSKTKKIRDRIQAVSSFAKTHKLPAVLRVQMHDYSRFMFREDVGVEHQAMIEALPKGIRSSIARQLFYPIVTGLYLFDLVSPQLVDDLVCGMMVEDFPANIEFILQNESANDFYIIVTGVVELLNGNAGLVKEVSNGEMCGEVSFICNQPQLFTFRTQTVCQLLRMKRETFSYIMDDNAEDGTAIISTMLMHLQGLEYSSLEGVLENLKKRIIFGRKISVPLNLYFAASLDDHILLHLLLRRGLDPNILEANGRAALHVAASQGLVKCVRILLRFEASPNLRDFKGSVPMLDRIFSRSLPVMKLLDDAGANVMDGDVATFLFVHQNDLKVVKDVMVRFR